MDESPGFESVRKYMLELITRSCGIPESLLTGDGNSNYSSAVIAGQQYLRQFEPLTFEPILIINCSLITEHRQFRFPRSKKRRIREKWSKDYRNFRQEPSLQAVREGTSFFVHPRMRSRFIRKLKKALAKLKPKTLYTCY